MWEKKLCCHGGKQRTEVHVNEELLKLPVISPHSQCAVDIHMTEMGSS